MKSNRYLCVMRRKTFIYIKLLLLPRVDCHISRRVRSWCLVVETSAFLIWVSTGLHPIHSAFRDYSAPLVYEDGNRLYWEEAAICGLTAMVLGSCTGHFPKWIICSTHYTRMLLTGLRVILLPATQRTSPKSTHICALFADYWGAVMNRNCDTEFCETRKTCLRTHSIGIWYCIQTTMRISGRT